MSNIYFPSCNFNAMRPETGKRIRAYLAERMPVKGCCRFDKSDYTDEVGIYLCQACREVLEPKLSLESLWQYIDRDPTFELPTYAGLEVVVQDCWRDRSHPEIMDAVRSLLDKMQVSWRDLEGEARERSTFCGDIHFEPSDPELVELAKELKNYAPPQQPPAELIAKLMSEQAAKFAGATALTYCNRCTTRLIAGGASAVHVAELVFGTYE